MMSEKIQVPEGYKKTELGLIPEEWNIGTLENIAEINPKTDTSSLEENTNVTFLPMQNVGENGKILKYDTRNYHEVKKGYTCFAEKDVLFAKITPCMENGKGTLAINLENKVGFGSTEYHVLRAKQNGSPEFTFYLTKWEKFRKEAEKYMTGSAGQRRVSKNIFSSYKIPIPTLPEQQKIASILSKADEQIEQTEQIIEKTELLIKGLRQKLLTKGIGHTKFKKTELGEIPEEWEVCKFIKYIDIKSGKGFKLEEYSDSGIKLLRIDNVSHGKIVWDTIAYLPNEYADKNQDLVLEEGDILLALNRPVTQNKLKIGILKQEDLPSILYQRVGKITFNRKINSYYVYHWLTMFLPNFISKKAVGSDQPFINLTDLRKMTFFVPSEIEQQKIASILSKVDSQIQDNQNYLTRLLELKKGLMHDLLTGKVRVCI